MISTTQIGLLLAAVVFGPMAYRMVMPTPPQDLKAIERFLKNRDQRLLNVQKLWIGGPSRWGGRVIYTQTGRPYRVIAQSSDGRNWRHDLALDGSDSDALGNPKLKQRLRGEWSDVIQ